MEQPAWLPGQSDRDQHAAAQRGGRQQNPCGQLSLPGEKSFFVQFNTYFSYQMVSATLTKVREIKLAADARPVVLLGWGVGAAIAAHVAGMERLAGLVGFGHFF